MSADSGDSVPCAFDTVDQYFFISQLKQCVGIKGCALNWLKSYLNDRTLSCLSWWVFLLFLFWIMESLRALFWPRFCSRFICFLWVVFFLNMECQLHFYADDTQIYLHLKKNCKKGLSSISACLMRAKLRLLCLGPQVFQVHLMATREIWSAMYALKFDKQKTSVVKSFFFQLRILSKAKIVLTLAEFERVIHFI